MPYYSQDALDAAQQAALAADEYAGWSNDDLKAAIAKHKPHRAPRAVDGPVGLADAYQGEDVWQAAHDALRASIGRPVARPHPGASFLRDAKFTDITRSLRAAGYTTDAVVPDLIEQVAFSAAMSVMDAERGRLAWCARARMRDYKQSAIVTCVGGEFVKPGEAGIVPSAPFTISGEAIQVEHFVSDWLISMEALQNSGTEAVRVLTEAAASAAGRQLRRSAVALIESNPTLQDGVELFAAGRDNVVTGATLNAANIGSALDKLASMATADSSALDAEGRYLLVASSNYATARTIAESMGNELTVIGSPGISTGLFYLLADPQVVPAIALATLEASPFSISYLGIDNDADVHRWRVRLDYGIAAVSPYCVRATA
jgi:hypothetical protein